LRQHHAALHLLSMRFHGTLPEQAYLELAHGALETK
jgi:hypothetical protein